MRPLAGNRPLKSFAQTVRDRRNNDNTLWAIHKLEVRRPDADMSDPKEGRFIREFGGMEKISESADQLLPQLEGKTEQIIEQMPLMDMDVRVIVRYDIIPPANGKGARLIYYVYEKMENINDEVKDVSDTVVTSDYIEDQTGFLIGKLSEHYPDSQILHKNTGVSSKRPTYDDEGMTLYYTG